ncbi:amidohydrolase family protein [Pseudonocardia sp. DSM 110487]|uniref:amidohydrolase family protein n=1 Tax=Pseudonocardia sp. DSM 110487 TaxID=2865833 RepID=UPI001C6A82A0|nr:amidohydrolase family protein [Pseudonocardia sp. DSM 110487]QYN36958.1 amidohydrolase family protein [Pseudonocardia sp. DSM 110487]
MNSEPRPAGEDVTDGEADAPEERETDEASSSAGARRSTRRTLLKRVGLGAVLIGAGAAGYRPIASALARDVPPRTTWRGADGRVDNVTVVDPLDGSRIPGRSIVVRNGRIAEVLSASDVPGEKSMPVIDGAGRFAVPGYNQMHTHALQYSDRELAYATLLAQGVTGMRQMEGSDELLSDRAEQRLGLCESTPAVLQMPGNLLLPFNAGSVDDVREEIARQWDAGADFIKMIMTERDVFLAAIEAAHQRGIRIAGHLPPSIRMEEASEAGFDSVEHVGTGSNLFLSLAATPDELWRQQDTNMPIPGWLSGLPFTGELFDAFLKDRLINSVGVADPDDPAVVLLRTALASYSEQRAAELGDMLARNMTWQCPTLINLRSKYRLDDPAYRSDPWLDGLSDQERRQRLAMIETYEALPAQVREINHEYYERALRTIGIWSRAGVPIMTGTDGPGTDPARAIQLEFRELARAGLSPLDVLRAATTAPATYLGLDDRMGRVAAGMEADFLLLDADPLDSVDNLGAISMVFRAGHAFTAATMADKVDDRQRTRNANGRIGAALYPRRGMVGVGHVEGQRAVALIQCDACG